MTRYVTRLCEFISKFRKRSRERLMHERYLSRHLPVKGGAILGPCHRTPQGNRLLLEAKDTLFALLFGDDTASVRFERVERELPFHAPRSMSWQDPEDTASDERADNVIIEVELGEVRIVTALRLMNLLEVNEEVLYARMADIEQSTLVD